jgi:hypothetical protein
MENIDCPTAKQSLLAYLTGRLDGTGEGAEFEAHVKDCDVCRSLIGDRRRALQLLIAAIDEKPEGVKAPASLPGLKKGQIRLLAVSGLLAVGLIGVSYFVQPGSSLLGEKFGDAMPPLERPKVASSGPPPDTRAQIAEETEEVVATLPVVSNEPEPQRPAAEKPEIPEPKESSAKPKTKVMPRKTQRIAKPPEVNRVEVFDASGKKVGETIRPN